ncbi:hypothetical protein cypCar_00039802 [Cyprinus carpio]|nr:hypothetical protein cypCar_00039802 [Cyprinus carpio]
MFSPGQEEHCAPTKEPVKYGELVVLGYNGSLPNGDRGRRKSRFALYKRAKANGVKPSTVHILNTPQASKAVNCKGQHSISYTLSRNQTVVVEYSHDKDTDMFQEKAAKWKNPDGHMDGLTTNGVLVMHPRGGFTQESKPGVWREISVCGDVYTLRETRSALTRGKLDGSLVDLCGATLLWRTADGLFHTPTQKHLEALRQELNAARPQCPVGLNTLAFPSMQRCSRALASVPTQEDKQPWVYLACGHVHGYHDWGHRSERDPNAQRECPMCRTVGPYVPLWLGCEPAFYVDTGAPTHAFVPCGHVCSEKSARYWAEIPLPHGTHAFHAACPFCATQLNLAQKWAKLIFQGPID